MVLQAGWRTSRAMAAHGTAWVLIPDRWRAGPAISGSVATYVVGEILFNNDTLLQGGLLSAFADFSSQKAGRLDPLNTADALVPIEVKTLLPGRECNIAPYVRYREYVSLTVPTRFEDISGDSRVVKFLSELYRTPGEVEFYVGLFAEDQLPNSPLPPLILAMVALDAFSQALTNPLLSEHVFKEATFTPFGWEEIHRTRSLANLVARNIPGEIGNARISMTQADWTYQW